MLKRLLPTALVLLALICGAAIFAFPFLDMVFTSVKLDDEMATDSYRLLPKAPHAQHASPFVYPNADRRITRPADMPRDTWSAFEAPFTAAVREGVAAWYDAQPFIPAHFPRVDRSAALDELTQQVGQRVLARIPDDARAQGPDAMLAATARLLDHDTIFPVFTQVVPRFAVGNVRVRLADFSRHPLGTAADWTVTAGPATLAPTSAPLDPANQLTFAFPDSASSATLRLTPPASLPFNPASVDRLYISYLPDRSWAKLDVFVTRAGTRYQMREPLYADDLRWNELELRWPDPAQDALAGRSYRLLDPVGPAPASDPLAVELVLTPNSAPGAWWAKASRNYHTAFQQVPIARYIMTSAALAILNIILVVFASSFAAYAFARIDFPGREFLFAVLLATMMIPGQVTMIPTFLIFKNLGWFNTLLPLWVPAAFGTAFFIFMMRQFLKSIPKELEEAARIDGCGFIRIYWHIMLPLIRPTLAAVAMFAFLGSWNNFMGPLIYVNDERMYNLAFGLFKFQLLSGSSNALMMAGAFVMTLPIILTFFLFQRYFVQGIALSGLGGK